MGRSHSIATARRHIEGLAARYPDEIDWTVVLDGLERPDAPAPADTSDTPEACISCEAYPAGDEELCVRCSDLYRVTHRDSIVTCDCGHESQAGRVFEHLDGGTTRSLCGPACVRRDFLSKFGFFLIRQGKWIT